MRRADRVDKVLDDSIDSLDDEIGKLEKELSKQQKELAKALADLKEAERKLADERKVRRLPRDAKGNPVIDGPLGSDEPFDPSAPDAAKGGQTGKAPPKKDAPAKQPADTKQATPAADTKKSTATATDEPKSPADQALDILERMDADEAARKVGAGAEEAARTLEPGAPSPASGEKSLQLPRDAAGNPIIDAPLGQPSPRSP